MTEHRRPGRPQVADPDAIARIAVDLFADRGFDPVTMDQIATASGVSRRTLFRHFPSKAALVWYRFFAVFDELVDRMAEAPPAPGVAGVREFVRPALQLTPETERNARVRLAIIARSPDVLAAGLEGLEEVRDALQRHLSRGPGGAGMESAVSAVLVMNAVLAAAMWWAESSTEPLADVVDRALLLVREIGAEEPVSR